MTFGDFHTHTSYCDGENTVAEMAAAAYAKGLPAIGFSGHGYVSFDDCCIAKEDTPRYLEDIKTEKARYAGKMEVFAGLEADVFSEFDSADYDYIIRSCHYLRQGERFHLIDYSPEKLVEIRDEFYGGDMAALCRAYYAQSATIRDADIVGHFDLVTKYAEWIPGLLDTDASWYRTPALEALDAVMDNGCTLFEVNTGAITRGYRTSPYPALFLLRRIRERGGSVILSGDAHSTHALCAHFDKALDFIRQAGFCEVKTLTGRGFVDISVAE